MANTNPSANMSLPVPVVGTQTGPQYAININDCLTILDAHNHTPGYGVAITPAAMDINSDLSMSGNNLTAILSARFSSQNSTLVGATDLGCLYEVMNDLYFNDGSGTPIRITQNGGLAGTAGSIANLVSPASASYVSASDKFVWQSDTNTAADMDFASAIMRNLTPNSFGLTLEPPAAMGADFTITLPSLPLSQKIVTLDASGAMAASWAPDTTTIEVVSNNLKVKASGIVDGTTLTTNTNVISVRNGDREHAWELNGIYSGLTFPLTNIDSMFLVPYNIEITSVWIYITTKGSSGTTEFDLKAATGPGGAFTSILTTTGKFASTLGTTDPYWTDSGAIIGPAAGVTKPVLLTTTFSAGAAIRFDLIQTMGGSPLDARIKIFYKQT